MMSQQGASILRYKGVDYNTDILGLHNTNILTAITPGTLKIQIDEMTAVRPLGPKQAQKFLGVKNFRVPGVISIMSTISIFKVPGVIAVKVLML